MRLRYWIKEALKLTGILIIASFAYTLLMMIMGLDAADTWRRYLNMGAMWLGMFGAFMSIVLGASIYQVFVPLAISFGSTRKEVFWGLQCYRFVVTFFVLLVAGILCAVAKEISVWIALPFGICAFLVFHGMGAIMGGLSSRLGKTALVIMALVGMLLFIGMIGLILLGHNWFALHKNVFALLMPGIGVLVYALCMIYEVKTIRKFSVK
jgi:hypothetical protein